MTRARPARPRPGTWQVGGGLAEVRPVPGRAEEWVLSIDGVEQSHVDLADPTHLVHEYVRWTAEVLDALRPGGPLPCVHLGAGAGTLARWVAATRPGSAQVVLDPDEALLAVARDVLGLRSQPGLRVRPEDGRQGLARVPTGGVAAVVRDAFEGAAVPDHLMTVEFVSEVARVLDHDGVYVANLSDRAPFEVLASEVSTVRSVFGSVAAVTDPATLRGRRVGNVLVVGSHRLPDGAVQLLSRRLASAPLPARVVLGVPLESRVRRVDPLVDGRPAPQPPSGADWS